MVSRKGWAAIAAMLMVVCGLAAGLRAQIYTPEDARYMARKLYLAILGREADGPGLAGASAAILRGEMNQQIQGMLNSQEFRQNMSRKRAPDLVDQFYRGLLGRGADPSGLASYTPRVENRDYAGVILELLGSPEFRQVMVNETGGSGGGGGGGNRARGGAGGGAQASSNPLDDIYGCEAAVLLKAWRVAREGRVFLTFDRLPQGNGDNWQGEAVDRFLNRDRRLSYRCGTNMTEFSYADRGGPTVVDPREPFPSAAVRNCENAKGGAPFVAASLSAGPSAAEYVIGFTRDEEITICTMDRQRVVAIDTIK